MPNAGFLDDVVFGDPSLLSASYQNPDSYEGETSIDEENGINNKNSAEEAGVVTDADSVLAHVSELPDVGKDVARQVANDVHDLKITENVDQSTAADQSNAEDQHILSAEELDALLDKCLLQALHTTVKDKDLPMSGSTLW